MMQHFASHVSTVNSPPTHPKTSPRPAVGRSSHLVHRFSRWLTGNLTQAAGHLNVIWSRPHVTPVGRIDDSLKTCASVNNAHTHSLSQLLVEHKFPRQMLMIICGCYIIHIILSAFEWEGVSKYWNPQNWPTYYVINIFQRLVSTFS